MATKARLHGFWRGAIAVAAGWLIVLRVCCLRIRCLDYAMYYMQHLPILNYRMSGLSVSEVLLFEWGLPILAALTTYGLLTSRFGVPAAGDGECHCRRCNHILRGLSEPRCPECGEAI
jgi:uncharacterized protein YbdZ (MbtH family)